MIQIDVLDQCQKDKNQDSAENAHRESGSEYPVRVLFVEPAPGVCIQDRDTQRDQHGDENTQVINRRDQIDGGNGGIVQEYTADDGICNGQQDIDDAGKGSTCQHGEVFFLNHKQGILCSIIFRSANLAAKCR